MAKILVAEDESAVLELVRFSLDAAGHQVVAVSNGRDALETARKESFDLILLDVMMPFMDGYHVAREISEDPDAPAIILLTSRDFDKDTSAVKGCGAAAFISKPFEVTELLDVVANFAGKIDR